MTQFRILVSYLQARFNTDERGAALVEYALLVALIAVVCILALTTLGGGIRDKFTEVNNSL
ncbi:MAG: Flp family type IVb pilin [Actinobacteria bacterium]|nr:Flp family type IVb pilin [Actinomycetota bacterium]